jgi:quercetin dioxygenase-like cupin family protein
MTFAASVDQSGARPSTKMYQPPADARTTRTYRAGESWSEEPGAIHSISRNASKIQPAKLLAVFVRDTNDNVLTTPIK